MSDLENLAVMPAFSPVSSYELIPRGLQAPELKKVIEAEPKINCKIEKIFEEWCATDESRRKPVKLLIKNLEYSLGDIYSLLISKHDYFKKSRNVSFASVLISELKDKVINFNLSLSLSYLGCELPADKVLVVNTNADLGWCTTEQSKGITILAGNSKIQNAFVDYKKGLVIVTDKVKLHATCWDHSTDQEGILIALKDSAIHNVPYDNPPFFFDLRSKDSPTAKKINQYLDNFMQKLEIPWKKAFENNTAETIRQDITGILKEGGYNV